jgi:hypothetical protein
MRLCIDLKWKVVAMRMCGRPRCLYNSEDVRLVGCREASNGHVAATKHRISGQILGEHMGPPTELAALLKS